jgi:DNA repair protein RadA/Sms
LAKRTKNYVCKECGATFPRWSGRCPNCEQWDTLEEVAAAPKRSRSARARAAEGKAYLIGEVPEEPRDRVLTGIGELDRALGGGVLPGSTILLGGDPGIGKSTLMLQALGRMAAAGVPCLYVSCEESLGQLRLRSQRLGVEDSPLRVASETYLDSICGLLAGEDITVAVVDSIQMVNVEGMDAGMGSIRQLSLCATELVRLAKAQGFAVFLIGHVTKQGAIAGPKALEHIVDTVLYFESERFQSLRILRAAKNRFGSINEIGVFQMTDAGLEDVPNPSELFLAERDTHASGSVVAATIEGNRALLVEIQALVSPSAYGTPERKASGLDYRRFGMVLAVLERRTGLNLSSHDTFANVAGGVRVMEPAADLPLALAVMSSARDLPFPADAVVVGEVGLGGEIRAVSQIDKRLKEAEKLGFARAFIPKGNAPGARKLRIAVQPVPHLRDIAKTLEKGR